MRSVLFALLLAVALAPKALAHGGGLNACGCHFNGKTGECHCHRPMACGCECEPPWCGRRLDAEPLGPARGLDVRFGAQSQQASSTPDAPVAFRCTPGLLTGAESEPEALAGGCGVERWKVKTLSDPAAKDLHRQKPRSATVEELASMPAPPWSRAAPRSAAESSIYALEACVVAYALSGDSDLHVVVQGESGATMIVKFPDAASCAPWSHAPGLMLQARDAFMQLMPDPPTSNFKCLQPPIPARVIGPLFMDKVHGQVGVAPNGAEIHPILRVTRRKGNCGSSSRR